MSKKNKKGDEAAQESAGARPTSLEEKIARLTELRPDLAAELPSDITELELDGLLIEAAGQAPAPTSEAEPAKPGKVRRLTADDLRKTGYVQKERPSAGADPGKVCIITMGNKKLFFPGDEEKAGALSQHELDGSIPEDTKPKTFLGAPKMSKADKQVKA